MDSDSSHFLKTVLTTAEDAKFNIMKEQSPKIIAKISKLKSEVKDYQESLYVNLNLVRNVRDTFLSEALDLNTEMNQLIECVNESMRRNDSVITNDLPNIRSDLQEARYSLKLVTNMCEIDKNLNDIKQFMIEKQYLQALETIEATKRYINTISNDEKLEIINSILTHLTLEYETLNHECVKIWNESVLTNKKVLDHEIELSIKVNTAQSDDIKQCLKTLCSTNSFHLNSFSNFLLNEFFNSIINDNCTINVNNDETESCTILTLIARKIEPKSSYKTILNNITTVIDFILNTVNFETKPNVTLLQLIMERIGEKFAKNLIENCLTHALNNEENYEEIVSDLNQLQNEYFIDCEFVVDDIRRKLVELHGNQLCQTYLSEARALLKKDLHDMVEVGEEMQKMDIPSTFQKCFVSRSTCDYLNLIERLLDEAATNTSDTYSARLVCIVDKIIGLYSSMIMEYHKKLLETIPQQVALYYNNCNYLAMKLITVNKYFKNSSKQALNDATFVNHIRLIKTSGASAFQNHIDMQTKQILNILKESELTKLGETDKLDAECEKSIRQCLRQSELLKTVWQKVLSYDIYNQTIGLLLNTFVSRLIRLVIDAVDISAYNCTFLVKMFEIVQTRGPKLFSEPNEINLYVDQWYKFIELIYVLNSGLMAIDDRWADGKGPLAIHFQPEELKQLIRALFQNTDRRAALIAKIN